MEEKSNLSAPAKRAVSAMLDKGMHAQHISTASRWFERLPPDSHPDLESLLSAPNRKQAKEAHEHLGQFFANAKKHGWNSYHTAIALSVLNESGGKHLEQGDVEGFKHIVRALDYLGPWVKAVTTSTGKEEDLMFSRGVAHEADRVLLGTAMVGWALNKVGVRHVNAAARLLEGKDHSIYPLRLYFIARTRRLIGPKSTDRNLRGKESNIFRECDRLVERFLMNLAGQENLSKQLNIKQDNAYILMADLARWREAAKRFQ